MAGRRIASGLLQRGLLGSSLPWRAPTKPRQPFPFLFTPPSFHLPCLLNRVDAFARRPWKARPGPFAWIKVGPDEECPSSQPNKGSVKNRNQKRRMLQRHAFRKAQVQASIASCKAAKKRNEEARRKRWKEGAARAKAWAEKMAQKKQAEQNLVTTV